MKNVNVCNSWYSLFYDGQNGWFKLFKPFKVTLWKTKKTKLK